MFFKFAIVVTLSVSVFFAIQTQGCQLYCLVCRTTSNASKSDYYCCMENWQETPIVRDCGNNSMVPPTITTSTDPTSVVTQPTTPCPPCPTCSTPPPNRCPKSEKLSDEECNNYKRFYPNPILCTSDKDCSEQFNVCCEDQCFDSIKICKTEIKP